MRSIYRIVVGVIVIAIRLVPCPRAANSDSETCPGHFIKSVCLQHIVGAKNQKADLLQAPQKLQRVDRAAGAVDVEQVGSGGRVVVHREAPAAPEEVGEPGGVVVVLSEALHVVLEGVDAGGGQSTPSPAVL